MPMPQEGPDITWTLTLPFAQAQMVLGVLSQGPFNQVAPIMTELQRQATPQIQAWQRQMQMPAEMMAPPMPAAAPLNGEAPA